MSLWILRVRGWRWMIELVGELERSLMVRMVRKVLKLVMWAGCGVRKLLRVEKVGLGLLMMLFELYPFRSIISLSSLLPFFTSSVYAAAV
jgi:hypothetical protein